MTVHTAHHLLNTPLISTTPTTSAATSRGKPIRSTISFINVAYAAWGKA